MVAHPRTSARPGTVRPLNLPRPVAVEADPSGQPVRVLWQGRLLPVVAIHDRWRIDDEWWREEIARRYFLVELQGGRRLTLFHDLVHDVWYEQPYEPPRKARPANGA